MYTLIPLRAEKHKSYCGRVSSLQGLFSPVAKFCSWETSGGEQSTSLAWIWVRTAKRLLQLTRKATLNQWKMSKADFHSNLPLYFFDKPHMAGLANSWWRTSYLPADLNSPLSCFFQLGSAPEFLATNCFGIVICLLPQFQIMWMQLFYELHFQSGIRVSSGCFPAGTKDV